MASATIPEALACLERACEDRDDSLIGIKIVPFLDPIRLEPGFIGVLRKVALEAWSYVVWPSAPRLEQLERAASHSLRARPYAPASSSLLSSRVLHCPLRDATYGC